MGSDQAQQLRQQGIAAAKAGQKDQARALFQQALKLEPNSEVAWLWMASLAMDRQERLFCLKKLLTINPGSEAGRQAVEALGIPVEKLIAEIAPPPQPEPAAPVSAPPVVEEVIDDYEEGETVAPLPEPEGPMLFTEGTEIPVLNPDYLDVLNRQAGAIIEQYLDSLETTEIEWVRKEKRRAGERDIIVLRLQVASAVIAFLLVFGGAAVVFVANSPEAQRVLFVPTNTVTPSPTSTSTSTPGFTPTPSPTSEVTLTPSPTINPSITPGNPTIQPRATELYLPERPGPEIRNSAVLLQEGNYTQALPTLAAERERTFLEGNLTFNPNPYYYEAVGLIETGDTDRAKAILDEAEERMSQISVDVRTNYQPLIDLGFAHYYKKLAEEAAAIGDTVGAARNLEQMGDRAESAIFVDPNFAAAYVMLADRYALARDYDRALGALSRGQEASPDLFTDMNLRVRKTELFYEQQEYALTLQEAFEALYVDPFSEPTYQLQIKAAMEKGDPGLGVIYAQRYLFYYPGSREGYRLLGNARVAEGNSDLALTAFSRALEGLETPEEGEPVEIDETLLAETYVSRAVLYERERRYGLALDDLTRAFDLTGDTAIQGQRMQMAYLDGDYELAAADAEDLLGSGALPDSQILLTQARILLDQAGASDMETHEEALSLLTRGINQGLPEDLRPIADEYLARTQFRLGNLGDALNAVDRALSAQETGSRHYQRGQILAWQGDRQGAIAEYEWVLTWNAVYPYPFGDESRLRLTRLRLMQPKPTPTPET